MNVIEHAMMSATHTPGHLKAWHDEDTGKFQPHKTNNGWSVFIIAPHVQ